MKRAGTFPLEPGMGRMLLISLGLHLVLILLFAGQLFRMNVEKKPVYVVDLTSLPVIDPLILPPQAPPALPAFQEPLPAPPEPTPAKEPEPAVELQAEPPPQERKPVVRKELPQKLPPPKAIAAVPRQRPAVPDSLPAQQTRVETRPEVKLDVRPSIEGAARRSDTWAERLPQEPARLQTRTEKSVVIEPKLRHTEPPRTTSQSLPVTGALALAAPSTPEVAAIDPSLRPIRETRPADHQLPSTSAVALPLPTAAEPVSPERRPLDGRYRDHATPAGSPLPGTAATAIRGGEKAVKIPVGNAPQIAAPLESSAPAAPLPGGGRLSVSRQDGPELDERRPTVSRPAVAGTPAATQLPAGRNYDFLDSIDTDGLDSSKLVSLNRLETCRDPEAEKRLKGRLAALVTRPRFCRTGGIVFNISNPESAWSVHLDIYNYEQREFQDRCDALRLAVECCERSRR